MKKKQLIMSYLLATMFIATMLLTSCGNDEAIADIKNPFDEVTKSTDTPIRDKIVVISDIHLGNDSTYSECVKHLPLLKKFLTEIRESETIKELVIAGDLLDEWYLPSRLDTYNGGTQKDFVKKIAQTNKVVVDELNNIIQDKKIKVTYVPGNHDLFITPENANEIFPGINQARDDGKLGIGTYHPDGYPQIAIEHSHRYDFFCALDPYSKQNAALGSVIPPGYFFTRIAVNSVINYPTAAETVLPRTVTLGSNYESDDEQVSSFIYYKCWQSVLTSLIPVKDNHDDKIIETNIEKYKGKYSINDVVPFNTSDGKIDMNLFSGSCSQQAWEKRLAYNNVPVMTNVKEAIKGSLVTSFLDQQANAQYFQNKNSNVRIVIFGHTHIPMMESYSNRNGESCIYANSGTWTDEKVKNGQPSVDQNKRHMDFVVIGPQHNNKSMIDVELFNYHNGNHNSVEIKSIKM
jgi:UDP-2,3-diacylglucosamine pyrophosphatase LpxH